MDKRREEAFKRIVAVMSSACNACGLAELAIQNTPEERKQDAVAFSAVCLLERVMATYPNGQMFRGDIELIGQLFGVKIVVTDAAEAMRQNLGAMN